MIDMRHSRLCLLGLVAMLAPQLAAWSPRFHQAQTMLAVRLTPLRMQDFLNAHAQDLAQGARGQANDQVPTVEEVEDQWRAIVELSDGNARPERVARELGTLAHQVQLLMDPSAVRGATPLRDSFEAYGDEKLPKLVLSREPFWAVTAPLDPRPQPAALGQGQVRAAPGPARMLRREGRAAGGAWDELSLPFAQLQLAYSKGINATANLWIQLWRAAGDRWQGAE